MRHSAIILLAIAVLISSSCASAHRSMKEQSIGMGVDLSDFVLSDQVEGTATSVKIFLIDWNRLLHLEESATLGDKVSQNVNFSMVPVIGSLITDNTVSYALYDMMAANPGYDVVIYPQYETYVERPVLGLGFIYKKTTAKARARLGKLRSE